MFLVYRPEGEETPKRWKYSPKKLMSAERESLERRTGRTYAEFVTDVQKGSSACRRALLHVFLKREHPTIKYEDVDFAWDELDFEYSKSELRAMREHIAESAPPDQVTAVLEKIDAEIETAFEDPDDEGKAQLPVVA